MHRELRSKDGQPVTLRPAEIADDEAILAWQSEPGARRHSRNPGIPARATHFEWFRRKLDDPGCLFSVVTVGNRPCGVLRLDRMPLRLAAYEVSILLAGADHDRGIGRAALRAAHRLAGANDLHVEILPANVPSIAAFRAAGFRPDRDDWYRLAAPSAPFP